MGKFFIRGRRSWGARPAKSFATQRPGVIHTIVVHHTAGKRPVSLIGAKRELRSIQAAHMDAHGWSDIGYNYVIDGFGRVWEGRGAYRIGAHTLNHNTGTVGISFMGNYENQKLSPRQIKAFRVLVQRLAWRGITAHRVCGHNQMPDQATACPGRHITKQLNL